MYKGATLLIFVVVLVKFLSSKTPIHVQGRYIINIINFLRSFCLLFCQVKLDNCHAKFGTPYIVIILSKWDIRESKLQQTTNFATSFLIFEKIR